MYKNLETPYIKHILLNEIPLKDYLEFSLTKDQFSFFEEFCSNSQIRKGWEEGIQWLIQRQERLYQEFSENLEDFGHFGSVYPVCRSYWDRNTLIYETTRGTILIVFKSILMDLYTGETENEVDLNYIVLLPKLRLSGNHHRHLILALAGMTPEIWKQETVEGDFLSQPYYNGKIPLWMEDDFRYFAQKFQYPLNMDTLEELSEEFSKKTFSERL